MKCQFDGKIACRRRKLLILKFEIAVAGVGRVYVDARMMNGKEKREDIFTIYLVRSLAFEIVVIWRIFIPQIFFDIFECQIARIVCYG